MGSSRGRALLAGIGLAAVLAAPARAQGDALLPIPSLLRPTPAPLAPSDKVRLRGGCRAAPLPTLAEQLPFGPGEAISYDVGVLGMRTGRVGLRMGQRTRMDGEVVYPLFAEAQTTGFLSVLGELDGRMVSYFDPDSGRPVRMVNQFVVDTIAQAPKTAREDAAFSSDAQVAGELTYRRGSGASREETTRPARLKSTSDLLDVLSVIYYMRSREMTSGDPFCFEIYHRRRLWRVEGRVGGTKVVRSPFTSRRARRVEGTLSLVGGGEKPPRDVVAWVSDDDDRLPLLVETPDGLGTLTVKLRSFASGRRLSRSTEGSGAALGR